mgnify:CR=1 FL=1
MPRHPFKEDPQRRHSCPGMGSDSLYSSSTALLTAIILATATLHVAVGSINILDMMITMFMTLSLAAFYKGRITQNRRWYLLMYAAMAFGLLTKGLISIVLPLGIIFWYMIFTKRWSIIRDLIYLPGILLFLIISVPWFYLVCQANHDFFYFFFIRNRLKFLFTFTISNIGSFR